MNDRHFNCALHACGHPKQDTAVTDGQLMEHLLHNIRKIMHLIVLGRTIRLDYCII